MGTYNPNGGRNAPDENRPTWRPQDPPHGGDYRGRGSDFRDHDIIRDERWRDLDSQDDDRVAGRDPRRWEGSRGSELGHHEDRPIGRSTERYGQGQSGYGAGRYGDDRSPQMRNRNDLGAPTPDRDFGGDERFYGRGGLRNEPWRDEWRGDRGMRGGIDQGTGYDQRMGYDRDFDPRGAEQRMDYSRGDLGYTPYSQRYGGGREEPTRSYGVRGSQDAQGYRGSQTSGHTHRGTGPHRGKGPAGYQRSDERIRELVCDALADDDMIDASQIHVTVEDGEVTLAGVVDDRRTKREAEDCVAAVPGVRDVQIQLRVKGERSSQSSMSPGAQPPGNGAIAAKPESDDEKHRA